MLAHIQDALEKASEAHTAALNTEQEPCEQKTVVEEQEAPVTVEPPNYAQLARDVGIAFPTYAQVITPAGLIN